MNKEDQARITQLEIRAMHNFIESVPSEFIPEEWMDEDDREEYELLTAI